MKNISLKELLEAGCHFGHQVPRWNPRAASFIYTARDSVHIIDLAKTKEGLEKAAEFIQNLVSEGKAIVFVGTKRQAKAIIKEEAKRVGALYLVARWPGGLLTNWWEIKKNLDKLNKGRTEKKADAWAQFTKKEQLLKNKDLEKLEEIYGGIAELTEPPAALFLIDIKKEDAAVREALKTGIQMVAIVDTNTNPDLIDYPIPANDDAVGSIKLITGYIADAYKEGRDLFEKTATTESAETGITEDAERKKKTRKQKKLQLRKESLKK